MTQKIISTCFLTMIVVLCFGQKAVRNKITPIPNSQKTIDIPKYPTGEPFVFWHFCKQKETQLGMSSAENSIDSILIRVWVTVPTRKKNQQQDVIELRYNNNQWTAVVVNMRVDLNDRKLQELITQRQQTIVNPRSNWNNVRDSLFYYQINALPTDEQLPNYNASGTAYLNHSPTFCFEYTTPKSYRFYQYSNLAQNAYRYPEAMNVSNMLSFLDKEFRIDSLTTKFNKSLMH